MATTVFTSQNPEIVSKGTFTLNVRIKKTSSSNDETEDQINNKLDNNFLEGTDIPSKSNIQFSIKDENPIKKKITPIAKKEVSIIKKKEIVLSPNSENGTFGDSALEENLDFDLPSNIIREIVPLTEEKISVKKLRIMGHYFYVSVKSPYYIYCLETLDKIGLIKENREIEWYE